MAIGDYTQLTTPADARIEACPCCGSAPELWQYEQSCGTSKSVMCSNGSVIGPQDAEVDKGCLLNLPPDDFYKATIREAVGYWNDYAKALTAQQRKNRWATAQVMRRVSAPLSSGEG